MEATTKSHQMVQSPLLVDTKIDVNSFFKVEQTPVGVAIGLSSGTVHLGGVTLKGLAWDLKTTLLEEDVAIGSFNVIGQIADDTYESGQIAYMVAKQILKKKQPNNNFFENSNIYQFLYKSNGASAGCTMTTSLLSLAMKKLVRNELAMTGEISLTGQILDVGGVRRKTKAAKRRQIKTIIFPEANRRDFEELKENVKEGLNVHFVDHYEQIFEIAFNYDH